MGQCLSTPTTEDLLQQLRAEIDRSESSRKAAGSKSSALPAGGRAPSGAPARSFTLPDIKLPSLELPAFCVSAPDADRPSSTADALAALVSGLTQQPAPKRPRRLLVKPWGGGAKQQQQRRSGGGGAKASETLAGLSLFAGPPQRPVDPATGEAIPDFGVDGALEVLQLLGKGGSGETYLARCVATNSLVAAKFLARPLPKLAVPLLMREVELQARLGQSCPNIVSLHELVLTPTHLAIVQEYAAGGTLTDAVACNWESALGRGGLHLTEPEARFFLRQVVSALAHCHAGHIAHRDLKLDNIVLGDTSGAPRAMLCDYGFARSWGPEGSGDMHTALGTPAYMSPQILGAKFSQHCGFDGAAADVWAAGITLFACLFGCFPFDHHRHLDPNSDVAHLEVRMAQEALSWRDNSAASAALARGAISVECADLLDKMLEKDESKRINVAGILAHPWTNGPLASAAQEEAWDALKTEAMGRADTFEQPGAEIKLKRLRTAMLAMLAASTRVDAEAPLAPPAPSPAGITATIRPAAPHKKQQQQQQPPRRRGDRHESLPTIAQIAAAGAASRGRRASIDAGPGGADTGVQRAGARDWAALGGGNGGGDAAAAGAQPPLRRVISDIDSAKSSSGGGGVGGMSSGQLTATPSPDAAASGAAVAASAAAADAGAGRLDVATSGGVRDQGPAPGTVAAAGKRGDLSLPVHIAPPPGARPLAPWGVQDLRTAPAGGSTVVWRLPLVVWAPDEALKVPLRELQVAAGALTKQLQTGGRRAPSLRRISAPDARKLMAAAAGIGVVAAPLAGI